MSGFEQNGANEPEKPGSAPLADMDRRSLRTRQALHQALLQLIREGDYDEITVGDIADRANVGRSTFYAHFTDKDDLLRAGAGHLRALLLQEHGAEAAAERRPEGRPLGFSRFMTAHLKEQQPLYRALMRGRAGPIIIERLRQFLCEIVRAELAAAATGKAAPELTVQFVVGAYMSVLTWWMDRGAKESPEAIDRAFRELAMGSLKTLADA